jgi:hypothetical protein
MTEENVVMAKGQQRQPKEKKKPKADGKDKPQSGYKSQYGGGGSSAPTLGSKK